MKLKRWQKNSLSWALWMFIIMSFFWPWVDGEEITLKKTLIGIPIWLLGGFLFGYLMRKNYPEKD